MDLYVGLLPEICVLLFCLWFGAFVWEVPGRIWFPLLNLAALEGLWICLLITEPLKTKAIGLVFAASVYCGLGILVYVLVVGAHLMSRNKPEAPPPVPAHEPTPMPAAEPVSGERLQQLEELRKLFQEVRSSAELALQQLQASLIFIRKQAPVRCGIAGFSQEWLYTAIVAIRGSCDDFLHRRHLVLGRNAANIEQLRPLCAAISHVLRSEADDNASMLFTQLTLLEEALCILDVRVGLAVEAEAQFLAAV